MSTKLQHTCKHSLPDKLPTAAAISNVRQQHNGLAPCFMLSKALLTCSVGHTAETPCARIRADNFC